MHPAREFPWVLGEGGSVPEHILSWKRSFIMPDGALNEMKVNSSDSFSEMSLTLLPKYLKILFN